jgi:PKHD-type hydroxylase
MHYSIPAGESPYKQDLAYWEDFLSNDEINALLARPEWLSPYAGLAGGELRDNVRRSNVAWLTPQPELDYLYERLVGIISEVNRRYFNFDISGLYEAAQLTHYSGESNGYYDWHVDSGVSQVPRKLSMTLLLDEVSDFDGGELQLKIGSDSPTIPEQKKGRAWFFPSHTLHRVTPVTRGIRRSLVLWVGGPPFR